MTSCTKCGSEPLLRQTLQLSAPPGVHSPHTLEQNGLIERFFKSLKEECVWQQTFADFAEARRAVTAWIGWYNASRPHQALGYRSPLLLRAQHAQQVA